MTITKLVFNCQTQQQTIIELTEEEILQIEADKAEAEAETEATE